MYTHTLTSGAQLDHHKAAVVTHICTRTHSHQVPSLTITKLLWLKRHEPGTWARTAAVMLPHDYINRWLTGRHVAEVRKRTLLLLLLLLQLRLLLLILLLLQLLLLLLLPLLLLLLLLPPLPLLLTL